MRTKYEHEPARRSIWNNIMSSDQRANTGDVDGLEAAVDQAIAACGGDLRSAIRALIVANDYLETEVGELMKAVSHAYVRGRFHTYSG
jgi:hypothetical protein